jgi:hypothetical protein
VAFGVSRTSGYIEALMLSPAVLIVLITSPLAVEPTTASFERAVREVLGSSAEVHVETLPTSLPDRTALARAGGADGVVELSWSEERSRAVLHSYVKSEQRWIDRTIEFNAADRDGDRGRLLGFAVASMFMDAPRFVEARDVSPVPATPDASPAALVMAAPVTSAHISEPSPSAWPGGGIGTRSLEFAGIAALGFGANGEAGARAALSISLSEPLWLRLEVAARAGEIPLAQANVRRLQSGVGLAWSLLPEQSALELRARADALGGWMEVGHLSSDDVKSVRHHRWLLGADAVATLGYRVSTLATVYAGLGLEAMLGRTHVYTHGAEVASVPGLRGMGEAGFRTSF